MNEKFEVKAEGRLTRDPELRRTPNGTAIAAFGLATSQDYKKNDEWVKNTLFTDWQAWGDKAEEVVAQLNKGAKVNLVGKYSTQSWDDKKTGEKRTKGQFTLFSFSIEGAAQARPVQPPVEDEEIPF